MSIKILIGVAVALIGLALLYFFGPFGPDGIDDFVDHIPEKDRFIGRLALAPIGDGRMELLSAYQYKDRKDKVWTAPKGYKTDGASIPQILWSVIGGPFTGDYLHAAVIHDVYCEEEHRQGETWQQVHRMFHQACLDAGCAPKDAAVLFRAVWIEGPRWGSGAGPAGPVPRAKRVASDEELLALREWAEQADPTAEQIENWELPR